MAASTPTLDPWAPPESTEWRSDPQRRGNHVAALMRHNERLYRETVAFHSMWCREIAGTPTEARPWEDRAEPGDAEMIAELVKVAHDRRQLGDHVVASFKDVATAIGVSSDDLAAAVRDALAGELAA